MLKKEISFLGVFSLASGTMISSGIFILPGLAFSQAGPAVFVSYFLAGVLGLIGILSVIELATAMPKAGGDYFFINKTFGPMLGTITGFLGWAALSLKSAFAIFGLTQIISSYTEITYIFSGLFLCVIFVLINIKGIKEAAVFQISLVMLLLLILTVFIVFGLPETQFSNFSPFFKAGVNDIFITSGFVFITFGGLLKVANVSEEVVNPKRNIPLGIISSVIIVTILYTLVTFVITGSLEPEVFKNSLTPVADSAMLFMGIPGFLLITIASGLAFISTANAGIMAAARYPMALSRDQLLPQIISRVNKKHRTPVVAIIITGTMIFSSLLLPLEMLVEAASTVILTAYVLTNLAVIVLRESRLVNYKPSFKTPLYPWLQIFSILLFIFFIVDLGSKAIEISLSFLFVGVCIYFIYGRRKQKKEYALLHLIDRITGKELTNDVLEDELRDVLIGRENINKDDFDPLIKNAKVLDIEETVTFIDLIRRVIKDISKETDQNETEMLTLVMNREKESDVCISDLSAILNVMVDGENIMSLSIVRIRKGIKLTHTKSKVKALFLLIGSEDKKILHLRTLSHINKIIRQEEFEKRWLKSNNTIELKNSLTIGRMNENEK